MNGLALRTISGIIYVAVIVCGLLCGDVMFKCFLLLFSSLAIIEFSSLANRGRMQLPTVLLDVAGGIVAVLGCFAWATGACSATIFLALYTLYIILRLVIQLYSRWPSPLNSVAYSLMSQLYIVLPFCMMIYGWTRPGLGGPFLLAMFVMIWLNDTGAFCVGSTLGRNKLFPRISPKKSWEGFAGGFVFSVCSAFIFKYVFPAQFEALSIAQLLVMGGLVSIFATWGDLVESMIKRDLRVKDSGRMIPGHGGILDRIDSLLLVSPALFVYLILII